MPAINWVARAFLIAIGVVVLVVVIAPEQFHLDLYGASEPAEADANASALDGDVVKGFELVDADRAPSTATLKAEWRIELYRPKSHEWFTPGRTRGARPTLHSIERFGLNMIQVLRVYPHAYLEALGLRRVMLLDNFHHKGVRVGLIAMGPYGTIAGDVQTNQPGDLHHELFHMADHKMFGFPPRDRPWQDLNSPGFRYSGGGRRMAAAQAKARVPYADLGRLTEAIPGFVSKYATAAPMEDRAELFRVMVTHPSYVTNRCKHDSILRAKADFLRAKLAAWEPSMGPEFWNQLDTY